jgi:hypothetical protein
MFDLDQSSRFADCVSSASAISRRSLIREDVMRTLLIAAALIYIFGATEVSASVIHIDFSGGAKVSVSFAIPVGTVGRTRTSRLTSN